MSTSIKRTLISSILGLLLVGCSPEDEAASNDAPPRKVGSNEASLVARLSLEDGTAVEFHEPQPGELVVATWAGSREKLAAAVAKGDGTAAGLYQALSGKVAPAALAEVDQRVLTSRLEKRDARPGSQGGQVEGELTTDGIGRRSSALTGQEFQSYFCATSSVYQYKYCWPYRSGYSSAWQWGTSMQSIVNAVSGPVYQQMDVRNLFWWNSMGWTVLEGQWFHMYSIGGFTERRVQAFGGASYHHSIFGTI